jgi:two-component system sensor histidine kinase KdpD
MSNAHSAQNLRPSPDALLRTVTEGERQQRGRLKVFLGAAPGVGKTYTMLEAARVRAMAGENVAVGVVETHGRIETAELLLGLDIIPRLKIEYKGRTLEEMNLDAILERRPQLVLVDELAHTNVPGSRHPKRYLDVEELLAAGIDVYTTVNIQHIDSLNDAVARITGVQVRETVPDRIMERADEVELIDLPVDDLLHRLHEGKVYVPDQAERAVRNYFRPGNLNALRQLALRHTAARVDTQMHTYMQAHAIPGPWPVTERLLVSVGPGPLSQRLVRATRRRAERRHAEWIAIYVETPRHYRLSEADRDRVAKTLRLAEELGGEAATVPGNSVSEELIHFAQGRNVTEIVIGKSHRSRWFELLHGSIVKDLIARSGNIDVYIIAGEKGEESQQQPAEPVAQPVRTFDDLLWSAAAVAVAALVCSILRTHLSLPNLSMVFLLAVLLTAVVWGLRASITASILSVLVYDFFFVLPYHTFTISSPQDVLSLIVFLVVAIFTSNLTVRIRDQAEAARRREARTAALYDLSREIAGAVGLDDLLRAVVAQVSQMMNAKAIILLPDPEQLTPKGAQPPDAVLSEREHAAAVWSWQHNQVAGNGTDTLPGERWFYMPLHTVENVVGVLALCFDDAGHLMPPDQRRLLEALADQAAVAIERAGFARNIVQARLLSERERLQAILLSSISHDLRTPLASILGSATSLLESDGAFDSAVRHELLTTIREEAERLNRFVGNLLDTTRLESGALTLNRDWVEITDLVGAASARLVQPLAGHRLEVDIEPSLPLLHVDFVLIEQVLVNLLDNAARYSDEGGPIRLRAFRRERRIVIQIEDEGIGIPGDALEKIFDKFYRVRHGDRQLAGTGLGLSICRGIIEEHGGTIVAGSPGSSGRGAIFTVMLPLEEAPPLPEEQP